MAELADVTINGDLFMLAAGGYERGAEAAAPSKPGRLVLSTFNLGLGWVDADQLPGTRDAGGGQGGGGWGGVGVHAIAGGAGLEPWPKLEAWADANLVDVPSATARCTGIAAADRVYLMIGTRLYRTVTQAAAAWGDLVVASPLSVAGLDLAYYRDDVVICRGATVDMLKHDTSTASVSLWRAGEQGHAAQGYHGVLLYAGKVANQQELLYFGLSRFNGDPEEKQTWLDAPIVRMGLFAGQAAIATKTSLYLLSGEPYEGVFGDGGGTARWDGPLTPIFSHGSWINDAAGDFRFLLSLHGKLYTWLAGSVVEYDPGDGREGWRRLGPSGRLCTGGCVAAGHLVVSLETAEGLAEVWAYDGFGWWRVASGLAPGLCWPVALHGIGGYDLLVLTAGSTTYQLGRLLHRSAVDHAYGVAGEWSSPLLVAGNAAATKAWRQVAAYFAWPEAPGNDASVSDVTIALDYSIDAGASWTQVATATVGIGHTQQLEHEFVGAMPTSRLLQLRVRWADVADWAPVLSRLVVDYAVLDTSPRRRRWGLKVAARDRNPRRDGGVLGETGREQIDALWDAWREQTTVSFRDVDYDVNPTEAVVRIIDIEEAAPKSSDAGRWGDGLVTLTLGEV